MTILHVPEPHGEPPSKGIALWQVLVKALFWLIPKGSPDYTDRRFKHVAYWLVEVDEEGWPVREIGFNAHQEPILFAPTDRNMGFWTDSDRVFSCAQFESRNDFPFEETWSNLYAQTRQGTRSL